jgi:hypothetical protein
MHSENKTDEVEFLSSCYMPVSPIQDIHVHPPEPPQQLPTFAQTKSQLSQCRPGMEIEPLDKVDAELYHHRNLAMRLSRVVPYNICEFVEPTPLVVLGRALHVPCRHAHCQLFPTIHSSDEQTEPPTHK